MKKNIILILIPFLVAFILLNNQGFFWKMSTPRRVNWKAYWIRKSGAVERKNFYYLARKKFKLPFLPTEANLFISCQSRCYLYINGQLVQKIGLYSNPPYQYFDYLQVTKHLKKKKNVIAILGYNEGIDTFFGPAKPDGLLFQLEAKNSWQKKIIVSDKTWRASKAGAWNCNSERIGNQTGFQEIFDARKMPTEWRKIDFDDSSWEPAEIIGPPPQKPWKRLVLRPIPYLREETIPITTFQRGLFTPSPKAKLQNIAEFINAGKKTIAQNLNQTLKQLTVKNNEFLSFKLEKQIVGGVKICFKKGVQGVIDIGYAEALNEEGFPDTGRMIFQGDRLINPYGNLCWQAFNPRSFKYLILVFREFSRPVVLSSVEAIKTEYPVKLKSVPDFKDQLLNKIYQVGIDTLRIDMQETFTDCPIRERSQYIGDARVQALVAYSLFDDTRLQKKALVELAWSQDEEGNLSANYPAGIRINIPTYSLQWINMLWEYYQASADKETLNALYPTLLNLLKYFESHENQTGFLRSEPDWWIFIDHGNPIDTRRYSLTLQSSYYGALIDGAKIANVLRDQETSRKLKIKAKNLKRKVNDYFWQEKIGLFDDCRNENEFCNHFTLQSNYWALYWHVVDETKKKLLISNLLADNLNLPQSKTPFFNGFIAEVLFRDNKKEQAITLIKNYWGGMLEAGATTWWENFDLRTGSMRSNMGDSLAHAWGSLPTYLLQKYLP